MNDMGRNKHINVGFRSIMAAMALLLGFSLPSFAGTYPIVDVFNICNNSHIFDFTRIPILEKVGWVQRTGGLSPSEINQFAQVAAALSPSVVNTPGRFLDQYNLEKSDLLKFNANPDNDTNSNHILEKQGEQQATLLIFMKGNTTFCMVVQKNIIQPDTFIDSFNDIGPIHTTALATRVAATTDWQAYSKLLRIRTRLIVIQPNIAEIQRALKTPQKPIIALLMSTEVKQLMSTEVKQ